MEFAPFVVPAFRIRTRLSLPIRVPHSSPAPCIEWVSPATTLASPRSSLLNLASAAARIARPPPLDLIEHVANADPPHPSAPVLHRHRIVLSRLAVHVDHEIAELAIRSHALRVRVPDERHDRTIQRDADMQRARVGRQHECRAVEDRDQLPQSRAERRNRLVVREVEYHPLGVFFARRPPAY